MLNALDALFMDPTPSPLERALQGFASSLGANLPALVALLEKRYAGKISDQEAVKQAVDRGAGMAAGNVVQPGETIADLSEEAFAELMNDHNTRAAHLNEEGRVLKEEIERRRVAAGAPPAP